MPRFSSVKRLTEARMMKAEKKAKEMKKKLEKEQRKRRIDTRNSNKKIGELDDKVEDLTVKLGIQEELEYVLEEEIKQLKGTLAAEPKTVQICNVCYAQFENGPKRPMILYCGHSTCFECCHKLFEQNTDKREGLRCPCCRRFIWLERVTQLVTNYALLPE